MRRRSLFSRICLIHNATRQNHIFPRNMFGRDAFHSVLFSLKILWMLYYESRICSRAARIFGGWVVAKRLECVELAPAIERRGSLKAGASSTHSKRFAQFGSGAIPTRCGK